MQLELIPSPESIYPIHALLIRGNSPSQWLNEIVQIGIEPNDIFLLKTHQGHILGCMICSFEPIAIPDLRSSEPMQLIDESLFIPSQTEILPKLGQNELKKLLGNERYLLYFGDIFIKLNHPLKLDSLIRLPSPKPVRITKPSKKIRIVSEIKGFAIKPISVEEQLQNLEESFPKSSEADAKQKKLSFWEKEKLNLLKKAFENTDKNKKDENGNIIFDDNAIITKLESIRRLFGEKNNNWVNNLYQEYEDLETRNQNEVERLLKMLEDDPQEALKYAIPLNEKGDGRGGSNAAFRLGKRWDNLSAFEKNKNLGAGGGTAPIPDQALDKLQKSYQATAIKLTQEKKYKEAAFVYLKLLKRYHLAAQTLEEGEFYAQAASIYLKYCSNKRKAAICYEKGNMVEEAIELCVEMEEFDKAGDLYKQIGKNKEAYFYYDKVVQKIIKNNRWKSAAHYLKDKMNDDARSQETFLKGWYQDKRNEGIDCLSAYLDNLANKKDFDTEIKRIYSGTSNSAEKIKFLQVLEKQYQKILLERDGEDKVLDQSLIRELAYEIVSLHASNYPHLTERLLSFDKKNILLKKDVLRYL